MHKSKNPTHILKCLPRMSWSPANLYNLFQRTYGPLTNETKFVKSSLTMFQQKWKAKHLVRAYHGDGIQEGKFKKSFLPESLPPIIGPVVIGRSGERRSVGEKVPLASMMFAEVEKRLDTVVFRCCFADSVYKARQMVIHGKVSLNGLKHVDPNTKLQPGDLISVLPSAVVTLSPAISKSKSTSSSPPPPPASDPIEDSASPSLDATPISDVEASTPATNPAAQPLAFNLPEYASPFIFLPPYLEVSYPTCSAIYMRHPTAAPGRSEVPSPYEADGEVMRLAWEYYSSLGRKGDKRPAATRGKRLGA